MKQSNKIHAGDDVTKAYGELLLEKEPTYVNFNGVYLYGGCNHPPHEVEWKEVRKDAAIAAMQGMVSALTGNQSMLLNWNTSAGKEGKTVSQLICEFAVGYADNLIKELKKEIKE